MALQKSNGSSSIYLSVSDGSLVRTHKEANQHTTQRITKTGKLVHEEKFRDLTAQLLGLETKENDYGKQWVLKFKDGEDYYVVNMPYSSRYASSFLKALPNIDLTKEVRFMPWSMQDKNDVSKKITGVSLYQLGEKVAPAYTKESPNGLPQMQILKVKGKETWDDSAMMEFLEEKAKDCFAKIAHAPTNDEGGEDNSEVPF